MNTGIYQYINGEWKPICGGGVIDDTGWVLLTLNSGFVNRSGGNYEVAYRKINNQVFIKGQFGTTRALSVNSSNDEKTFAVLPSQLIPKYEVRFTISNANIQLISDCWIDVSSTYKGRMIISPTDSITISPTTATNARLQINNFSYLLD